MEKSSINYLTSGTCFFVFKVWGDRRGNVVFLDGDSWVVSEDHVVWLCPCGMSIFIFFKSFVVSVKVQESFGDVVTVWEEIQGCVVFVFSSSTWFSERLSSGCSDKGSALE